MTEYNEKCKITKQVRKNKGQFSMQRENISVLKNIKLY